MFAQIGDVGVALQKPQKLVNDGFHMQLLRRHQRKALRQVESHLMAENRKRARSRAIVFFDAFAQNSVQKIEILAHGSSCNLNLGSMRPSAAGKTVARRAR